MNFFRCYKEIWFGLGLGAVMWLVDAVMHTEIGTDAGLIDELAKNYLEFSRLVQAGETAQAIETLNSIESWLENRKAFPKS